MREFAASDLVAMTHIFGDPEAEVMFEGYTHPDWVYAISRPLDL